jgi:8-oxo-dGTP pyrophosphatase MutT (NUDIX family)
MKFAIKIYYNNKPLILTDDSEEYKKGNILAKGYMELTGAFQRNYRLAIQHLDKPRSLGAIIEDNSKSSLIKELEKIYEPIHAGGGIVFNEDGDLLMIYRRGKWDLPKGKRDEDETIEECAIREVSEETGLKKLSLGEKVCNTYHIYSQNKKNLLKHTVWYKMKGTKKEKPEPQAEENILEVRWVSKKDVAVMLSKSYEGIKEVLGLAGVKLK